MGRFLDNAAWYFAVKYKNSTDGRTATSCVVSIVSHGHGKMVADLVAQLKEYPDVRRIIVTYNISDTVEIQPDDSVAVIRNAVPKGFGANHNAAFRGCLDPCFCVLNPDIELSENPFPALRQRLDEYGDGIVAPLVLNPRGDSEDNARYFPTLRSLIRKAAGGPDGRYPIKYGQKPVLVDWVAGMFMLFRSSDYARLGGFDERYFLYYEDVDICARAWRAGVNVVVCPSVSAIHVARRESHRNIRYLRWHLVSMARYFFSGTGRRV
jgi:N-acetylglucosaminyl-diphospho-decaprenol L-rhamnosyltransferase